MPFVEKRMSPLLAEPLEAHGEIRIWPDGTIDKRVTSPVNERVRISAGTLVLERAGRSRTINLGGDPRWRAFHAGIAGLLNRDATALAAFDPVLTESADGWTLELRPRDDRGRATIKVITASGEGPDLLRLRFEQSDDEWQEMTFAAPEN